MAPRPGSARATHRTISLNLFFPQHSFARRGSRTVFSGSSLHGTGWGGSLEGLGMENHLAGGRPADPWRRIPFRAINVLSRLRSRFLSALGHTRRVERHSDAQEFRRYTRENVDSPVFAGAWGTTASIRR